MWTDESSRELAGGFWSRERAPFAAGYVSSTASLPMPAKGRPRSTPQQAASSPGPGVANENQRIARRYRSVILNTQAYGVEPLLCDAVLIVVLSIFSGIAYHLATFGKPGDVSVFAGAGVLVSLLFCGILRFKALRLPFGSSFGYERARDGLSSWVAAFSLFLFIAFTMRIGSILSRGAILSFFVVGACGILISRVKVPLLLKRLLGRHALDGGDVIIVGPSGDMACFDLINDLREIVSHEPHFVGYDGACSEQRWPSEVAHILYETQKRAHGAGPGEILVVGSGLQPARLNDILDGLAWLPRPISIIPDGWIAGVLCQKRTAIGKNIALEFQRAPLNAMQRTVKRAIDLVLATAALILLAPVMAVIAIAIKCDSPGPVMFRQSRTGYRGWIFRIFKFRTMTVLEDGPAIRQAQKHDNRVTRVGRFLRRTSLDELPQILNVIAGDMSLVGPRPHAVGHDRDYESQIPNYTLRQHILPGITGWAQINGLRGETSTPDAMHKRVEHDIWYLRNCSIALDVKILTRTVFEVMRARNAY